MGILILKDHCASLVTGIYCRGNGSLGFTNRPSIRLLVLAQSCKMRRESHEKTPWSLFFGFDSLHTVECLCSRFLNGVASIALEASCCLRSATPFFLGLLCAPVYDSLIATRSMKFVWRPTIMSIKYPRSAEQSPARQGA